MEAIALKNIPIVTDNGTTRDLAAPGFSYYVTEEFSPTDLAMKVGEILSLRASDLKEKMEAARVYSEENFRIEKMASYYAESYREMAGENCSR
jgi:glycosyltransferase involved in cell wall biosynthesis